MKIIENFTPNLELLSFDGNSKNFKTIYLVQILSTMKVKAKQQQNFNLQLQPFYSDFEGFDKERTGFLLQQIGVLCQDLHVQTSSANNSYLMKYLFTAADMGSRKVKKSFISTGAHRKKIYSKT